MKPSERGQTKAALTTVTYAVGGTISASSPSEGLVAMTDTDRLILQVLPVADSDAEELADLAGELGAELLAADAVSVAPLTVGAAPERAKGLGTLAGWLVAQFGTLDGLRAIVAAVRGWAARTGRTVEVSIGGDVLKVTGVTAQQQGEIIDTWLARHVADG